MLLERPANRRAYFLIADRHDFHFALAQNVEGDRRHPRGLQRVAQGRRGIDRDRDDRACRQRPRHIVPALGLGAEDKRVGTGQRDSRSEPAPADRNRDQWRWRCAGLGQLIEDFEADRALSRDDVPIVEARHQCRAGPGREPRGNRLAILGAAVVEDDLRALGPRSVDFQRWRVGRHDDRRRDAQAPRGDRHALRMIARREGHHAPRPLVIVEQQQAVGRAPQLECAAGLEALALEPHPPLADPRFAQRGANNLPFDPHRSGLNI